MSQPMPHDKLLRVIGYCTRLERTGKCRERLRRMAVSGTAKVIEKIYRCFNFVVEQYI